jgi:hypothetical protein
MAFISEQMSIQFIMVKVAKSYIIANLLEVYTVIFVYL